MGIYVSHSGKLWSTAIRLKGDKLCIYSPLPNFNDDALSSLNALGSVGFILAPNHYHHRGIAGITEQFPKAKLVCSMQAKNRLEKITEQKFDSVSNFSKSLPARIRLLEPQGLKTGEVWLEFKTKNQRIWVVADAFDSKPADAQPYEASLSMLRTFPSYGIDDAESYRSWLKKEISKRPPTVIVPCHGPPVKSRHLVTEIEELVSARL